MPAPQIPNVPARRDNPRARRGARVLLSTLDSWGVDTVFTVPGAQILPLLWEIEKYRRIRPVCAAHELGAAFMADGYARSGRVPGVCLAIGGPGAANMLTAAQTAQLDGSAVLFITGDVPPDLANRGAFQEAGDTGGNDMALFRRVVPLSRSVRALRELPSALAEARQVLDAGGCAHLSVPVDVLASEIVEPSAADAGDSSARSAVPPGSVLSRSGSRVGAVADPGDDPGGPVPQELVSLLRGGGEILILAGARLQSPAGARALRRLAETHRLPVVTTLAAKGLLPEDHPLSLGNCGFAGTHQANRALLEGTHSTLLMAGADFNERDSLAWHDGIRGPGRTLIRLDGCRRPYGSPIPCDVEFLGVDLPVWLEALAEIPIGKVRPSAADGFAVDARSPGPSYSALESGSYGPPISILPGDEPSAAELSGQATIAALRSVTADDVQLMVDGGSVRIFAGQGWQARAPLSFHSATSMAPTGWAIGAAIGSKLARASKDVVVLTGDGCMLMHGLELATAARYEIPMVVVLLDNRAHGSVARRSAPHGLEGVVATAEVDWPGFARSVGARGVTISSLRHLKEEVLRGLAGKGPVLLRVPTDANEAFAAPEYVFTAFSSYLG